MKNATSDINRNKVESRASQLKTFVQQNAGKREQLKYKLHKFIFGSKDTEGAGKLTVIYILLISIGFIYLYPVLYMISQSFMNLNDLLDSSINWIPSQLYVENYRQALKSMDY